MVGTDATNAYGCAVSITAPVLTREVGHLPGLGTANHRLGPLHLMHARFEGDHGDCLLPANRVVNSSSTR